MLKRFKNQRGDTIIEVLIVLAVLGSALGISYATASRSLKGARQAQEHTEALQILQSQIESLRYLEPSAAANSGNQMKDIFHSYSPFCVADDPTSATPLLDASSGSSCNKGTIPYSVQITYCQFGLQAGSLTCALSAPTQDDTFVLKAGWTDINGGNNDNVDLVYRLHP